MAPSGSGDPKDPLVAGVLAFCVPGLGHFYSGSTRFGVCLFVCEVVLFMLNSWLVLPLHAFQVFAAAGAASMWNVRHATTASAGVPPPPRPKALQTPSSGEFADTPAGGDSEET